MSAHAETDLNVLSGQRAGLFGLSILWIMLFHCSVRPAWFPLWLLASTGYAGVDVFLLLSGIGLYYSMERDPSPLRFYRRRLARLLPPFLLVALVYEGTRWAAGAIGAGDFLRNVTLISYWTRGDQSYWFLAAVGLFYLCYPLIYRMIKARHRLLQTLVLAASVAMAFALWRNGVLFYRYCGLVFRIPVFLLGCYAAPAVKAGRRLRTWPTLLFCAAAALLCWYLWIFCDPWYLRMYLFLPLSAALCLGGGILLSFVPTSCVAKRLLLTGGVTLELYLMHEKLISVLTWLFPNHAATWHLNLAALLLAAVSALLLHRFCTATVGGGKGTTRRAAKGV
ncbi:MAG: acyltransferase family protein [Oscillospiraceae bacterium]|nr:acyltransferase family protein [Oscillospiraceae bacterium]